MRFLYLILAIVGFCIVLGCGKSTSTTSNQNPTFPVMSPKDVTKDGCLNVELMQGLIAIDTENSPGYQIITDFQPDEKLNSTKKAYHTFSAFDLKKIGTHDIVILNQPTQEACSRVSAKTASGETLNYKVVGSSDSFIKLVLNKIDHNGLSGYRAEGLESKLHPLEYEISILNGTHIRVRTKYKSFDAHCRGKSQPTSKAQTDYIWARTEAYLPSEVAIAEPFYRKFLTTVSGNTATPVEPSPMPPPVSEPEAPGDTEVPPADETDLSVLRTSTLNQVRIASQDGYVLVPVAEVSNLLQHPVREELKRCK